MKILLYTFVFIFLSIHVSICQNTQAIDSIKKLLTTDKEEATKVIHLLSLSLKNKEIGEYEKGLEVANHALVLSRKLNYRKGESEAMGNIGLIYGSIGKYPEALDYDFKTLRLAEETGNKQLQANTLSNTGIVYDDQEEYEKALEYYLKSKHLAEELGDKNLIANNLSNIGGIYFNWNNDEKALYFLTQALKIKEEIGNKYGIANTLVNIGSVYYRKLDYDNTWKYYFKALKIKEELQDKSGIGFVLSNMGLLCIETKQYEKGEKYLLRSLALSEEMKSLIEIKNAHECLTMLYDSLHKPILAYAHFKKYSALKDSIFSIEKSKDIGRIEAKTDFDKRQAVADAVHKKEMEVVYEREKRQQTVSYSIAIGLIIALIFAGFIFNRFRFIRKQNLIIDEQKKVLEKKQKEILDSIHYAKRIQNSLMPRESYIDKSLNKLSKH